MFFDPPKKKWPKKYENPPLENPQENLFSWDHAQIVERKILYRIALTRAPETQTRPYFFQKYFPNFVNFDRPQNSPPRDIWIYRSEEGKIQIGPICM